MFIGDKDVEKYQCLDCGTKWRVKQHHYDYSQPEEELPTIKKAPTDEDTAEVT